MNFNNQDIYNQSFQVAQNNNQINNQPYFIGQPIDQIPKNNNILIDNNYGYQQSKQQVEVIPISNQQNQVVIVKTNPNMINIQFSNPEIIYCTGSIRSTKKHYNNGVGVNGIINALQLIYSEFNLVVPNLDLIGQFNFLSANQMENKVFQPIINSNMRISDQQIRSSKVFYCCKTLQASTIKQYYQILILLSIVAITLTISYPIYLSDSDTASQLLVPFIIQILLIYSQIIIQTVSLVYTLLKLLKLNLLLVFLNFLFGFIIIIVSAFVESNQGGNNNVALRFAVQIPSIFILMFLLASNTVIIACTKRFLVLLKQLEQSEFVDGGCI
ncbi:hypothetical protein ABPG72_000637 [Tetrahymena utriculariae]